MPFKFIAVIMLVVASLFSGAVTAATSRADTPTQLVKLDNGNTWRGRVGDTVVVEWKEGAAQPRLTGTLDQIEKLYIKFTPNDGSNQRVLLLRTLVSIESSDDERSESKGNVVDSKSRNEVKSRGQSESEESSESPEAKTGIFILPLSGTVGVEFRPEEIDEITRQADERGDGQIIVLEIDSGGGLVAEGLLIKEAIYKACERHTVVAWVDHAISGASWTALCCDQIVFKRHGHTGGITIMIGNKTISDKAALQRWIDQIAQLLKEKGRSTYWAKPFVLSDSYLSASKDPETGEITWYPNLKGDHIFSGPGQNLMFNAEEAVEYGFANGIANTPEELAEVLQVESWELDGNGQELHDRRQSLKEKIVDSVQKDIRRLEQLGTTRADINKAIKIYQSWLRWWRIAPNQAAMTIGLPRPESIKESIEELRYRLKQMTGGGNTGRGGGGRGAR